MISNIQLYFSLQMAVCGFGRQRCAIMYLSFKLLRHFIIEFIQMETFLCRVKHSFYLTRCFYFQTCLRCDLVACNRINSSSHLSLVLLFIILVTCDPLWSKILNRKFQKKRLKLYAFLSSMMKTCAIPLRPACDMNTPFVQSIYASHPLVT